MSCRFTAPPGTHFLFCCASKTAGRPRSSKLQSVDCSNPRRAKRRGLVAPAALTPYRALRNSSWRRELLCVSGPFRSTNAHFPQVETPVQRNVVRTRAVLAPQTAQSVGFKPRGAAPAGGRVRGRRYRRVRGASVPCLRCHGWTVRRCARVPGCRRRRLAC